MVALGITPLLQKRLFFENSFGELVFVPLLGLFGAFMIACGLFKPEWLEAKSDIARNRSKH